MRVLALLASAVWPLAAASQGAARPPLAVRKIDPPNWYASLPRPMLLVHGEGFRDSSFTLSDRALRIEHVVISSNGHWAQLWLAASPAQPETIELRVRRGDLRAVVSYTFARPRAAADGASGVTNRDIMYLVVTDRFADGDLTNDGPLADLDAADPRAVLERARPLGWHGGDLRGIDRHLDYLQQLGITTLWITPVYQNHQPNAYHGYSATDAFAVDEHFGSLADLQGLAADLHARGMKLVLDTVPNHVGALHPWVADEPTPNWFHGTPTSHQGPTYDFGPLTRISSTRTERDAVLHGWFANVLPDMNTEDPAVAQYLRQNAVWWIEQTGADGLRLDTFAFVDRPFWHEYNATLHQLFPRLTEVGEIFDRDPHITSFFAGGRPTPGPDGSIDTGLYTPFDFPTFFNLTETLTGHKPMTALAAVLDHDALYPHPERLVTFLGNHDTVRFLSLPGGSRARLQLAFGLLATLRGTPQIYYGDELGMTGGGDPDDRRDMPGGFTGTANAFNAAGRTADQAAIHDWVQQALQMRLHSNALQDGAQQTLFADATTFAFARTTAAANAGCAAEPGAERVLIVVNIASGTKSISLPVRATSMTGCSHFSLALGGGAASLAQDGQSITVSLAAESIAVFNLNR